MCSLKTWRVRERCPHSYLSSDTELTNRELLTRLFRDPRPAASVLESASINELLTKGAEEVSNLRGIGPARLEQLRAAIELGVRITRSAEDKKSKPAVVCSNDVFQIIRHQLQDLEVEHFLALSLDAKHQVISIKTVSQGTVSECTVHPREVFCEAVRQRAVAVIAAHNHPSGDPEPSLSDFDLTTRLYRAGELLGIPLLDHLVIGKDRYESMADLGFLQNPSARERTPSCSPKRIAYSRKTNRNKPKKRRKSR